MLVVINTFFHAGYGLIIGSIIKRYLYNLGSSGRTETSNEADSREIKIFGPS